MSKLSAAESRELMVKNLKLALHGPESDQLERWPGFQDDVRVISPDQEFASDFRLNVPMHDGLGNEIVARPPAFLYGIGILYPKMTAQQSTELTLKQQTLDEDEIEEAPTEVRAPMQLDSDDSLSDSTADKADDEAPIPTEEPKGRPRTLALSVNVPVSVKTFEVAIEGATYEPINITVGSKKKTLWKRNPFKLSLSLDTTKNNEITVEESGLKLRLGLSRQAGKESNALCTVFAVNETLANDEVSQNCLFQSKLTITSQELLAYPRVELNTDETEESFSLLYRHHPIMSIGHGCDTKSAQNTNGWSVSTDVMPVVTVQSPSPDILDSSGQKYALGMLDLATDSNSSGEKVESLLNDYKEWISSKEFEADLLVVEEYKSTANKHLNLAKDFLSDAEAGWKLIQTDSEINRVFKWTSLAMNAQRVSASAKIRKPNESQSAGFNYVYDEESPQSTPNFDANSNSLGFGKLDFESQGYWRPFQLAFLLASIAPLVDKNHPKRELVDIIWMPTGGGKTEAYLALAAFTILWERGQEVANGGQPNFRVSVMMRYTLKLLTTQQVLRAAALICALEIIRVSNSKLLDGPTKIPFRIGAWLGGKTTANTSKEAVGDFTKLANGRSSERTFLLAKCPWCSAEMGVAKDGHLSGYAKKSYKDGNSNYISIFCPDATCPFSSAEGPFKRLPVLEVDEEIYKMPPSFIVGTIDKFAQLAWKERSRRLFGLRKSDAGEIERFAPPPDLMIQDELHLIAGPLGSMNALYEIALENLCLAMGGSKPRIVAATATTKNFDSQVKRLYGRSESRLLPPSGIEIEDNFFAKSPPDNSNKPGKTYVAVCASGLGTVVESQLRVIAAMAHGAASLEQEESESSDAWWTNLAFFSSRRSLGLQRAATQASLRIHTWSLTQRSGIRTGYLKEDGSRSSVRNVSNVRELTATSGENISRLMNSLLVPKEDKGSVDICFATSMIEVGVDVPRLGLMTVMGQPKSASQYIQVTGRVGRDDDAPGLVVVVLSPYNVRDRSHFENFRQNHERLYAAVESVSVTPFTSQSLSRAASGMLTTVLRATSEQQPVEALKSPEATQLIESARERARTFGDEHAVEALEIELSRLIQSADAARRSLHPGWDGAEGLLLKAGDTTPAVEEFDHWIVPNSMRSVDLECGMQLSRRSPSNANLGPAKANASGLGDLEEDLF
ncbi:helicase-related protein [Aurantimicrobium photophilum]|uniref:Helicase C-terminal domain-containing protein n=1 Tax=Aurantimicrobium photophilum TaxID=1987356 RepID=A0A2Z3S353_9MICO|nr:helicase-related protein [Aurantimicrobium photophilum]AWR20882.1 hypothetical protein AURMO_00263 [Aurantimicrobium photophilum]